jgi:hypothetical protein
MATRRRRQQKYAWKRGREGRRREKKMRRLEVE